MNNHLLNIFFFLAILNIKVNHFFVNGKVVTDAEMKKMGWSRYSLEDLNFCINKFEIDKRKERFLCFISFLSYQSDPGKHCWEFFGDYSVYEGKKDLGNIQSGDGCKFRPVGYFDLNWRNNYQKFSNLIGDENVMKGYSYVSPKYPFSNAGFLWKTYNINSLIDNDPSPQRICRKFAPNGVDCTSKVTKYYNKAKEIF